MSAEKYVVIAGWLCETYNGCTCGTPGGSYPHEQYCGVENIIEVERLLDERAALTAEVERLRAGRETEQEMLRNAVAQLLEKDDTIRRVKMELDHWRMRAAKDRHAMAKMATLELVAALTAERDEALAHVADARRIIEAALRQCDERYGRADASDFLIDDIRGTMAAAGRGTRPTGDCGCVHHASNHSHCYTRCKKFGCRMLGTRP